MENGPQTMPRQSPSERVVNAVAAYSNTDPMVLPPLYESIDADALNALLRSNGANCTVIFEYGGYEVTVNSDRKVRLTRIDE